MTRKTWMMCYGRVRRHTYCEAHKARLAARLTLLHDRIGAVLGGCALAVFFHGNKIKAAMRRNVRERRCRQYRAAQIIKRAVGRYGPERMLQLLPFVNELAAPKERAAHPLGLTCKQVAREIEIGMLQTVVRHMCEHPNEDAIAAITD